MARMFIAFLLCFPHCACYDKEASELTTDDMIFKPRYHGQGIVLHSSMSSEDMLWPRGIVPYYIDKSVSQDQVRLSRIKQAMNLFEKFTCIRFVPRTVEYDYVYFIDDGKNKCFSYVGRIGGAQELSVGQGCERKVGIIAHELLHALGFVHEQSRPDRDKFVKIVWDAIPKERVPNFNKYSKEAVDTLSLPYDYMSIMHYHSTAFSKDGRTTIITTDDSVQDVIGQREGFSNCDIAKINKAYECKVKNAPSCVDDGSEVTTQPPTVTPELSCQDQYPDCHAAENDPTICDKFPGIFRRFCDRTCNKCTGPICIDSPRYRSKCAYYSTSSYYCNQDFYFRAACPYSCGLCQ